MNEIVNANGYVPIESGSIKYNGAIYSFDKDAGRLIVVCPEGETERYRKFLGESKETLRLSTPSGGTVFTDFTEIKEVVIAEKRKERKGLTQKISSFFN